MSSWALENGYNFKEDNRVRCFAHCVNLGVKEALKSLSEVLEDLREVVKVIRSSSKRREIFKNIVEELKLDFRVPVLDVVTRWSSTFDMLECAFELRKVK